MYKQSDDTIKELESTNLSILKASELLLTIEDVEWMLQTESYRTYYLDRLQVLYDNISKEEE
jgi:hypothetical protein